jgi:putative transcriptional regulator
MSRRGNSHLDLSGSLLLAHPTLGDPHFRRTVVLISAHGGEGALGVILNRPMDKTLGELDIDFSLSPLADVPVFTGGPVNAQQVILTAWKTDIEGGIFRLFFGLDPEKAAAMAEDGGFSLRAFVGYAGWTQGQLEGELEQDAWVVSAVDGELLDELGGQPLWQTILSHARPELRLLAEEPEDPSIN